MNAEEFQAPADAPPNVDSAFTDTPRECKRIDSAKRRGHRANACLNAVTESFDGQSRPSIAGGGGRFQVAYVAADAGDSEQTAFRGEDSPDLIRRKAFAIHNEGYDERVDGAVAVAVDNAVLGGESHGGVDGPAVLYRAQRRAAAQVT